MSELADLESYKKLIRLLNLFQKVKQVSWAIDQTTKRYPSPEAMTSNELEALFRAYLALGFDLENITEEWKEFYEGYTGKKTEPVK